MMSNRKIKRVVVLNNYPFYVENIFLTALALLQICFQNL